MLIVEQIKLIYFFNNESEKNTLLILHQVLNYYVDIYFNLFYSLNINVNFMFIKTLITLF